MGGTLIAGVVELVKSDSIFTASVSENTETAAGSFGKYAVDAVSGSDLAMLQPGACFVVQRTGTIDQMTNGAAPTQTLDAGTQLTLNGPNASNRAIPQQSDKSYLATLYSTGLLGIGATGSPTLAAGTYTLAGKGGADVGAFSASTSVPGDFSWTNENLIANPIPRSSPLTVNWTGNAGGLVTILAATLSRISGTGLTATYSTFRIQLHRRGFGGQLRRAVVPSPAVAGGIGRRHGHTFGMLSVFGVPSTKPINVQRAADSRGEDRRGVHRSPRSFSLR